MLVDSRERGARVGEPAPARVHSYKRIVAAAVALAVVALALEGGGYSATSRATTAIIAWWLVILATVTGTWPAAAIGSPARRIGAALAAVCSLTWLSMLWAADNAQAFEDGVLVALYLGVFAVVVLASRAGDPRPWLAGLGIGLAVVAVLGILSRYLFELFPDQSLLVQLTDTGPRLSYPLNYWNAMGVAMATCAVLLVWMGATGRTTATRTAASVGLALPILAGYMTASRGAAIAALAGVAMLWVAGPERVAKVVTLAVGLCVGAALIAILETGDLISDGRFDVPSAAAEGRTLLVFSVAVLAVAVAARWFGDAPIGRLSAGTVEMGRGPRRAAVALGVVALLLVVIGTDPAGRLDEFTSIPENTGGDRDGYVASHLLSGSSSGRYQFWHAAVDAWQSQPLHGIGAGGFEAWWLERGSFGVPIRSAHSLFLETLAELGPLGLALLLGVFVMAVAAGWRRRWTPAGLEGAAPALAIIATGVVSLLIDWTWELPVAMAGVIVGVAVLVGPAVTPASAMLRETRFGWGVATFAAAWGVTLASVLLLLGDVLIKDSRRAVRNGDLPAAIESARRATVVQPWAAPPRVQLGLVYERAGRIDDARGALRAGIDRSPKDWRTWVVLARVERAAGNLNPALDAIETARRLNPNAAIFRTDN